MTVLNRARVFGVGVTGLAAVLIACSGGTSVGSKYVKTVSVGVAGATISVATSDDATIAGTKIVIPPNALATTTSITIGVVSGAINPTGTTAIGPAVEFGPSGTKFAVPVTITLPVTLPAGTSSSRLFVEALESSGDTSRLAASYSAGLASFRATGFTEFGGCIAPAGSDASFNCLDDSDCAAGQVCNSGICVGGGNDAGVDATSVDGGPGCSDNTDCPSGESCIDGFCSAGVDASFIDGGPAGCTTDADCASGEECISGECFASGVDASFNPDAADAAGCSTTNDCPSDNECCNGVCVDITSDPSACGSCGTSCATGQTCASGVCQG